MSGADFHSRLEELADLVRQIPPGRCTSYGALGRALLRPVSGFLAGKWMAMLDTRHGDVPWWRVVKADGTIATFDRDPQIGIEQSARLVAEGVAVNDGRADMARFGWDDFDQALP